MSNPWWAREWGRTIRACEEAGTYPPSLLTRPLAKAVLLDRDGTLIADRPYRADPDGIELLPGVVEGLSMLREAGYLLIVVTNQSGIARGLFDERALARVHERLNELLVASGVRVTAYYFCPHHIDGTNPALAKACDCRKPAPGMISRAASDWAIDLGRSWLIGDMPSDRDAARAAGCRALLVSVEDAARRIIATDARAPERRAERRRVARRG